MNEPSWHSGGDELSMRGRGIDMEYRQIRLNRPDGRTMSVTTRLGTTGICDYVEGGADISLVFERGTRDNK